METMHTSESLKAQDTDFENFHYQLEEGEQYQLTEGEIEWLDFIYGKYCIYDHVKENSKLVDGGHIVYTVDIFGMSEALENDGISHKAVMLSDDSALQAIFFYSNQNN
jgi:hypothetical protein